MPPPMFGESFKTPGTPPVSMIGPATPPWAAGDEAEAENEDQEEEEQAAAAESESKPSITDLLKNPTKVVMCKVSCESRLSLTKML